jgi:hypothetical protein
LQPLTIIRAFHWIAAVLTGWSLNVLWGVDSATGSGAPPQWERHVVGAALLLGIAALAISLSGRGGKPPSRPALAIALAGPAGALGLSLLLRSKAIGGQMPHLVEGPGWKWMSAGAVLGLCAALASMVLFFRQAAASARKPSRRKKR